jgi:hypothetical protein
MRGLAAIAESEGYAVPAGALIITLLRSYVGALPELKARRITVPAENLIPVLRKSLSHQLPVKSTSLRSPVTPVFCPIVVDVIHCQESPVVFSTARTSSSVTCSYFFTKRDSLGALFLACTVNADKPSPRSRISFGKLPLARGTEGDPVLVLPPDVNTSGLYILEVAVAEQTFKCPCSGLSVLDIRRVPTRAALELPSS